MNLSEFEYFLPQELIAQEPLLNRTDSKLMVLNTKIQMIQDEHFESLLNYLSPGDLLVLNNTRVIPARLKGQIKNSKSLVEVFLLEEIKNTTQTSSWTCLVKPGKKFKQGTLVEFNENVIGQVEDIYPDGIRLITFNQRDLHSFLGEIGEMPLPPYIKLKLIEQERYQTVFGHKAGSVAAPTAGLHFTKEYLKKLEENGIRVAYVTLSVGLGTFLPVKTDQVEDHQMHFEKFELNQPTVDLIQETKKKGGRVIAVGTTTVRVLESSLNQKGELIAQKGSTNIFIYPPYQFKIIDGLLTNFHLPKSTLLMLVSALAGKDFILKAYQHAILKQYRFFSFGDAMLIL